MKTKVQKLAEFDSLERQAEASALALADMTNRNTQYVGKAGGLELWISRVCAAHGGIVIVREDGAYVTAGYLLAAAEETIAHLGCLITGHADEYNKRLVARRALWNAALALARSSIR